MMNPNHLRLFALLGLLYVTMACKRTVPNFESFEAYPVYNGSDLGLSYAPAQSTFKVWAPTAIEVELRVYEQATGGEPLAVHPMSWNETGLWFTTVKQDLNGRFYTYRAKFDWGWNAEVQDPYSKLVGVNGRRSFIGDLKASDPEGFDKDKRPDLNHFNDIILYELHVRDATKHENANSAHPGKFKGLATSGTKSDEGLATGLDHLQEMGVTHVHLLPVFDFKSLDETKPDAPDYNWGYDPLNYFAVEGSYSTDAQDPIARSRELKELVMAMHNKGIRVVMDVVFNHTGPGWDSNLNQLVPNYYYRLEADSSFSNASACGNETASEHPMFRKLMIDALKFWATDYHIDGFRFDLMGIHDIETMNQIRAALNEVDSTIFIYGEGWSPADSPYPFEKRAVKHNIPQLPGIAAFNDELRDGVKGPWNNHEEKGFVAGKPGLEESIRFGIAGSADHPEVRLKRVNYSNSFWANEPTQCVTFVSCHDDLTLYDKWKRSCPDCAEQDLVKMQAMALSFVLTSQGVPFLHAGTEFLRSKQGDDNSYKSPDAINAIDWGQKSDNLELVEYVKGLIALRKAHPAMRMGNQLLVSQHLKFLQRDEKNLVAFQIKDQPLGEPWQDLTVAVNGSDQIKELKLQDGNWRIVAKELTINEKGLESFEGNSVKIPAKSTIILYRM